MEIKRFFADKIEGGKVTLRAEEFYHCTKVTRHKAGFTIIVCVGDGWDYYAQIETIEKEHLVAKVIRKEQNNSEIEGNLILFQGVCKELDFIVQKAVELGATKIVPFYSANTNITGVKSDRLQKIVLDAAKQCGRARLPIVTDAMPLDRAIELSKDCDSRLLCYENCKGKKLKDALPKRVKSLALFIGSEGGFTPQEADFASEKNLTVVSLGKRILRAETAAIAALTLGLTAMGEL